MNAESLFAQLLAIASGDALREIKTPDEPLPWDEDADAEEAE